MRASTQSKIAATSIAAAGAGAALMFFLDPNRGRARRAEVQNKTTRIARKTRQSLAMATRDLGHRAQGMLAESWSRISNERESDNAVLVERVRSKMGRSVTYPGAIDVWASNGTVGLRGDVLQSELDDLLSSIRSVRGVKDVRSQLRTHSNSEGVPGFQGRDDGAQKPGMLETWRTPGSRMLVGATGGLLTLYGAKKGGPLGKVLGVVGLGLLSSELATNDLGRTFRAS